MQIVTQTMLDMQKIKFQDLVVWMKDWVYRYKDHFILTNGTCPCSGCDYIRAFGEIADTLHCNMQAAGIIPPPAQACLTDSYEVADLDLRDLKMWLKVWDRRHSDHFNYSPTDWIARRCACPVCTFYRSIDTTIRLLQDGPDHKLSCMCNTCYNKRWEQR